MPETEPECILPKLTEQCQPKCEVPFANYMACADRIAVKKEGDCEAWYFDYLKCLDKCRVPQLMKHLK